jgi:hypothetical protein
VWSELGCPTPVLPLITPPTAPAHTHTAPTPRGAPGQAALFLFVFMGTIGGYTSARLFRMFKFTRWRSNALWTAMLFPGIVFTIFFVLNMFIWGQKSSGAVPFGTLFALLVMWLGISVPLVLVGAFFGYRVQPIEHPVRINTIPRHIPDQPLYVKPLTTIIVGGILPFGAVFVEVLFLLLPPLPAPPVSSRLLSSPLVSSRLLSSRLLSSPLLSSPLLSFPRLLLSPPLLP